MDGKISDYWEAFHLHLYLGEVEKKCLFSPLLRKCQETSINVEPIGSYKKGTISGTGQGW
jgi:hypothetical protein